MRTLLAIFIFFFLSPFLWAQDDNVYDGFDFPVKEEIIYDDYEFPVRDDYWDDKEPEAPIKGKPPLKNRTVEFIIADINFVLANNFIAAGEVLKNPFRMLFDIKDIIADPVKIYRDPVIVNLDDFFNGFFFYFGVNIKPLSFNYNRKDEWGFGLDIGHISVMGNVSIPKNVLRFKDVQDEKFGAGGAVFADVGIPFFFHANHYKIKIRPAVYLPVVYAEPGIIYNRKNISTVEMEGTHINFDYDMRVYSLLDLESFSFGNLLAKNFGYDFNLGIEYPWKDYLDVGVDIANIPVPFASAKLNHYMQIEGNVFVDTSKIDLAKIIAGEDLPDDFWDDVYFYPEDPEEFEIKYPNDEKGKPVYRPFKMLFYADYRPSDSRPLSLIPSLGFSISRLYPKLAAVEGGLSARWDHRNIFITTIGINYNDRRWINSIDFVFNFRAFEFDFGLSSQSQSFVKSWKGAGLGVNLALKFGW